MSSAPVVPRRHPRVRPGLAGRSHAPHLRAGFLGTAGRLAVFCCLLLTVTLARAQSVHWENGDSGDPADVQLVFQDCAPEGDPQLPRIDGITLALVGTSSQTTLNNFNLSRSTILSYRARAQRGGRLQIPSFTVQTNKGSVRVPAFTGGTPRTAADANVSSRLEPGSATVWAGEVFPLTYVLDVSRRSFNQLVTNIEWNAAPLVVEDWSKFEPSESIVNGEPRMNIVSRTRAYAKAPGSVVLNAANQVVNLQSGSIGFGLFQTPRIEQLAVTSDRPAILVRPLPAPAPAGFIGAVGQFKLTSKVVPTTAAVGEPVTWTLQLTGTGNWPDIAGLPQREVSKDFKVVQPQAKRTSNDNKLFDATLTEDVVLIPTHEGDYTIGPLSLSYFDPAAGEYRTVTTPRTRITITPPAAAPSAPPAGATATAVPGSATPAEPARPATPPAVPAAPSAIPREPLSGSTHSLVPWPERQVVWAVLIPFALLPVFWAWLAIRRAQQTDPARPLRDAKRRLATTIAQIRASRAAGPATGAAVDSMGRLLLRWQHDSARLWRIAHAAPSPAVFAPPVGVAAGAKPDAAALGEWRRLWTEADRALYSAGAELPADWADRAAAALAGHAVPGFQAWTAFLPRNLLPFVALFAVACLGFAAGRLQAIEPATAYRAGDFAGAGKAWRTAVVENPTDAIARYNLSLALGQQDRWGEAAAYAAGAVIQSPGEPAIRAQLALACEKAGYVPSPLAGFLPPGPLQSLAGSASPGNWQLWLFGASVIFCVAIAVLLYVAYRPASRWVRRGALLVAAAATLLGLSATASLLAYGNAADRRAVIVWRAGTLRSIPTEADTTQKTTALAAGSVAVVDRTFLGWIQLEFDNGQTGWVRQEEVIPIWRVPNPEPAPDEHVPVIPDRGGSKV